MLILFTLVLTTYNGSHSRPSGSAGCRSPRCVPRLRDAQRTKILWFGLPKDELKPDRAGHRVAMLEAMEAGEAEKPEHAAH
jgi:hypothetical protein